MGPDAMGRRRRTPLTQHAARYRRVPVDESGYGAREILTTLWLPTTLPERSGRNMRTGIRALLTLVGLELGLNGQARRPADRRRDPAGGGSPGGEHGGGVARGLERGIHSNRGLEVVHGDQDL